MKQHALETVLATAFSNVKFGVIVKDEGVMLKWIDGPRIEQVGAFLDLETTDLSSLEEKPVNEWMRGYSPSAILKVLNIIASQTTTPIGSPAIREASSKFGFCVSDERDIDIEGQIAPLKVVVRSFLDAEDFTPNANIVAAVTVERWKDNLSISFPKRNGETVRFALGPSKLKAILAVLPDIQAFVKEHGNE